MSITVVGNSYVIVLKVLLYTLEYSVGQNLFSNIGDVENRKNEVIEK